MAHLLNGFDSRSGEAAVGDSRPHRAGGARQAAVGRALRHTQTGAWARHADCPLLACAPTARCSPLRRLSGAQRAPCFSLAVLSRRCRLSKQSLSSLSQRQTVSVLRQCSCSAPRHRLNSPVLTPCVCFPAADRAMEPLHPDWAPMIDEDSQRTYYFHQDTRETSWLKPIRKVRARRSASKGRSARAVAAATVMPCSRPPLHVQPEQSLAQQVKERHIPRASAGPSLEDAMRKLKVGHRGAACLLA